MFTSEQLSQHFSQVKTGADFPMLVMNLKNLGVTNYETDLREGRSVFRDGTGSELLTGPNYDPIVIADQVNLDQLKTDIAIHQQGKSNYFQISRQSADNGIEKWVVCLLTMTCTYIDKAANKVWVEQIPDLSRSTAPFTAEQIKAAHYKVKSGADFPAYIKEIKGLGVTQYETYVEDGHIDYHGVHGYTAKVPAKYAPLIIADTADVDVFKRELSAHQQGQTDFLTFIKSCAISGVAKWQIYMSKMTCTYYDKAGNEVLIEEIPG